MWWWWWWRKATLLTNIGDRVARWFVECIGGDLGRGTSFDFMLFERYE
jgi:hypothetical protein